MRLYPAPAEYAAEMYEDLEFPIQSPRAGPSKPYVFINMVSSLDGKAAVRGKAGGIGGDTDRETMRILRSKSDAVMIGAGTLRAEKVSLTSDGRRSPEPLAVVVSGSGDLPIEGRLIGAERDRTLVMVPGPLSSWQTGALSKHATVLALPEIRAGRVDLGAAITLLRRRFGVRRLLVEGGPGLNHSLVSNALADELFLTISPKLTGGLPEESSSILHGGLLPGHERTHLLTTAHLAGSELFLRYRLR